MKSSDCVTVFPVGRGDAVDRAPLLRMWFSGLVQYKQREFESGCRCGGAPTNPASYVVFKGRTPDRGWSRSHDRNCYLFTSCILFCDIIMAAFRTFRPRVTAPMWSTADSVVKKWFLWSVTLLICLKDDRPHLPRPWKGDPSSHAMLSFIYGFMVWLFGLRWGDLETKNPEPQWKCRLIKWVLTRSGGYVLRQLRWHRVWTFCLTNDVFFPHLSVISGKMTENWINLPITVTACVSTSRQVQTDTLNEELNILNRIISPWKASEMLRFDIKVKAINSKKKKTLT